MKNVEVDVLTQLENKKYKKNNVPIIIISIVLAFVALFGIVWTIFATCFPQKLGNLAYNINWNSYALKLYERDYNKSGNLDSLYRSLNLSIKLDDDKRVIKHFNEFYENENYTSYVFNVDRANMQLKESAVIKASLISEDNYLKNKYIESLIATSQQDTAFKFAVSDKLKEIPTYNNMGTYLFDAFCKKDTIDYFKDYFRGIPTPNYDEMLLMEIYTYMNQLSFEFDDKFSKGIDEVYVWAMGNRILQVGKNVLSLCTVLGISENDGVEIEANTKTIMDNVNMKFKLLIA